MFGVDVIVDYSGNYHTRVFKLVRNITGFGFNIDNNIILLCDNNCYNINLISNINTYNCQSILTSDISLKSYDHVL